MSVRIGIFIFLSLIFLTYSPVNEGFSQTREESVNGSAKIIKIDPSLRSLESEKIDNILIQWQSSPTPQFFAEQNNLQFSDGKVSVYIYLDSYESVSKLPNDIDFLVSSDNIAVALVSSEQINQLAQLDFVERITPPVKAEFFETRESVDEISKTGDSKINSAIIGWMESSDPNLFAEENNLIVSGNKIQVYVYLDSSDSISNIPQDVDVLASDDNIAVALVSSEQINQLAQLDFVERITPPVKAEIPPIPISQNPDQNDYSTIIMISIGIGIAIIVGIIFLKKKQVGKENL